MALRQRQAMAGLYDAAPPAGGFDPATDPLGLALKQRARDQRWQQTVDQPGMQPFGLPNQNWDAWFQALQESAGENPKMIGGPSPAGSQQFAGQSIQPWYLNPTSTMFAPHQESAITGQGYQPLNQPKNVSPAIAGLKKARSPQSQKMYTQALDEYTKKYPGVG